MRINGRFPQSLSARGRNASRFFPRLTNGISGSQCRQHRLRGDGKRLVMYRFPRLTRRPGNGQQFIIANAGQTNIGQRSWQADIFAELIHLLDQLRRSIGEHEHCQRAKSDFFTMPVFVRGG